MPTMDTEQETLVATLVIRDPGERPTLTIGDDFIEWMRDERMAMIYLATLAAGRKVELTIVDEEG